MAALDDLRVIADNLDDYVELPDGIDRLRQLVLHLAVSGQLVSQDPTEGTGEELYRQIQAAKANDEAKTKRTNKQKPLPPITSDEIPFAIPVSWKWVRAGELCNVISGTSYSKNDLVEADDGVRILRGGNVVDNGLLTLKSDDVWVNSTLSDTIKKVRLNDIVVVASTGSQTAIGKPGLVADSIDAQIGAFLRIIRPCAEIDPSLIWIWVRSNLYRDHIKQSVSGTNINNMKIQYITENIVPLPPLAEQKRIVEKVNQLMGLIDKLAKTRAERETWRNKLSGSALYHMSHGDGKLALDSIADLIKTKEDCATLRKSILHLAVSGQLVSQDPTEGTGEELYRQIQAAKANDEAKTKRTNKQKPLPPITSDEIPFAIPVSWKWVRLGEIFLVVTPKTKIKTSDYRESGVYPVVDQGQKFVAGYTDYGNPTIVDGNHPVIVFGDHTREVKLVDFSFVAGADGVKILYPYTDSKFMFYLTDTFKPESRGYGRHFKILSNTAVPLPPLAEQKRIVEKVNQLMGLIDKLESDLK